MTAGEDGRTCPSCGQALSIDPGFIAWCEGCDWNLDPRPDSPATTDRSYRRAAAVEDAVLRQAVQLRGARPGADARSLLAVTVAALTQATTAFLLVLGIWLLSHVETDVAVVPLAIACFLLAYAVRPRLGRRPKNGVVIRERAPALYGLTDQIAAAVGSPPVDIVVATLDANASTGRSGLRRHRVLHIGLPLWVALDWPERLGVLAHEAAHHVNGDIRRSYFLATSLQTLRTWIRIATPTRAVHYDEQHVFRVLVRLPTQLIARGLYHTLLRLSSRRSRLAEYRADAVAAEVAGAGGMASSLDKMLMARHFMHALDKAVAWQTETDIWNAERAYIDSFPAGQRERLRRRDARSASPLDATHPDVTRRIAYLKTLPSSEGRLAPSPSDLAAVDAEMTAVLRQMDRYVRARVASSLTPAQAEAGMGGAIATAEVPAPPL